MSITCIRRTLIGAAPKGKKKYAHELVVTELYRRYSTVSLKQDADLHNVEVVALDGGFGSSSISDF